VGHWEHATDLQHVDLLIRYPRSSPLPCGQKARFPSQAHWGNFHLRFLCLVSWMWVCGDVLGCEFRVAPCQSCFQGLPQTAITKGRYEGGVPPINAASGPSSRSLQAGVNRLAPSGCGFCFSVSPYPKKNTETISTRGFIRQRQRLSTNLHMKEGISPEHNATDRRSAPLPSQLSQTGAENLFKGNLGGTLSQTSSVTPWFHSVGKETAPILRCVPAQHPGALDFIRCILRRKDSALRRTCRCIG
jgi:hypothetical protein